jgi:DnaJ-class molecular chaperone
MAQKQVQNTCSVCGRPLEPSFCLNCAGSGKVKAGLFGKRVCEVCGGTGRVLQCPRWVTHAAQGLPNVGRSAPRPTGGGFATPIHRTCPTCKGTKGIRLPFTGQAGPCPTCKGKGWV